MALNSTQSHLVDYWLQIVGSSNDWTNVLLTCVYSGHQPSSGLSAAADATSTNLSQTDNGRPKPHSHTVPKSCSTVLVTNQTTLVEFAVQNQEEILHFLKNHTLDKERRPSVTSKFTPEHLKAHAPKLYEKAKRRIQVKGSEMNGLLVHLYNKYSRFLVGIKNLCSLVQRGEDVTDFILEMYMKEFKLGDISDWEHLKQDTHLIDFDIDAIWNKN